MLSPTRKGGVVAREAREVRVFARSCGQLGLVGR